MSRALPDVRDGLKPSQRRILVALHDLNLRPGAKHRKCAKIYGDTSVNDHPPATLRRRTIQYHPPSGSFSVDWDGQTKSEHAT